MLSQAIDCPYKSSNLHFYLRGKDWLWYHAKETLKYLALIWCAILIPLLQWRGNFWGTARLRWEASIRRADWARRLQVANSLELMRRVATQGFLIGGPVDQSAQRNWGIAWIACIFLAQLARRRARPDASFASNIREQQSSCCDHYSDKGYYFQWHRSFNGILLPLMARARAYL